MSGREHSLGREQRSLLCPVELGTWGMLCTGLDLCVCVCVCVCVCACTCMRACVCVHACIFVCVRACFLSKIYETTNYENSKFPEQIV